MNAAAIKLPRPSTVKALLEISWPLGGLLSRKSTVLNFRPEAVVVASTRTPGLRACRGISTLSRVEKQRTRRGNALLL